MKLTSNIVVAAIAFAGSTAPAFALSCALPNPIVAGHPSPLGARGQAIEVNAPVFLGTLEAFEPLGPRTQSLDVKTADPRLYRATFKIEQGLRAVPGSSLTVAIMVWPRWPDRIISDVAADKAVDAYRRLGTTKGSFVYVLRPSFNDAERKALPADNRKALEALKGGGAMSIADCAVSSFAPASETGRYLIETLTKLAATPQVQPTDVPTQKRKQAPSP